MKPKYDKPALTLEEQSDRLLTRGLTGVEKNTLSKTLSSVSYYRLRGYMYPYQDNNAPDTPFFTGTLWEYIRNGYLFDQQFRQLIFSAIENIEIALRTQLTLQMSFAYGSRWYTDKNLFVKENLWMKDYENLQKEWQRSKEVFTGHYNSCYDTIYDPPSWMIFETASFGTLSKYFENIDYTLIFMLDYCAPDYGFRTKLFDLMHTVRSEQLPTMGFSDNWQQEPLFKGVHTI